MKKLLVLSGILTWFNLIVWGFFIFMILAASLMTMNFGILVFGFILSCILLHGYATLQLRKSIQDPARPLANQTPMGIRFTGAFALFMGILLLTNGFSTLQNITFFAQKMDEQMAEMMKDSHFQGMKQAYGVSPRSMVILTGVVALILGVSIAANAIISFRMLRWWVYNQRKGE